MKTAILKKHIRPKTCVRYQGNGFSLFNFFKIQHIFFYMTSISDWVSSWGRKVFASYYTHLVIFVNSICWGLLFTWYLIGNNLNPLNINWMFRRGDPATYLIGWLYFNQDSWHWPITFTQNLAYPTGTTIAYTDSVPLFAVIFKVLGNLHLMPDRIQYFGILIAVNLILQFFWGAKLILLFAPQNLIVSLIAGGIFMLSPPLVWRLNGHFALTSHWLILASLWTFLRLRQIKYNQLPYHLLVLQFLLIFIASGINPYITIMALVLISSSFIQQWLDKKITIWIAILLVVLSCLLTLGLWYFWGYFYIQGRPEGGYDTFSFNLLAFFVSGTRSFPKYHQDGQNEGYAYLGLGLLLIAFANIFRLCLSWIKNQKISIDWKRIIQGNVILILICLLFTIYAISNRVTWGGFILFEYPFPSVVKGITEKFRASGRFIWPVYYSLILVLIVLGIRLWNSRQTIILLTLAIAIQLFDSSSVYHFCTAWMKSSTDPTLSHSSLLRELRSSKESYDKMMIFPSYQCSQGLSAYPAIESVAVLQKLKTNSAYTARYSEEDLKFHCDQLIQNIFEKKLETDTIYVLDKSFFQIANTINLDPVGSHLCRLIDDQLLCQRRQELIDKKIKPSLFWAANPIMFTTEHPDSKKYQTSGWSHLESIGTWSDGKVAYLTLALNGFGSNLSNYKVYLEIKTAAFVNEKHPKLDVDIFVNNQQIDRWEYDFFQGQINVQRQLALSPEVVDLNRVLNLEFKFYNPSSPALLGSSGDTRFLGILLKSVQIYGEQEFDPKNPQSSIPGPGNSPSVN